MTLFFIFMQQHEISLQREVRSVLRILQRPRANAPTEIEEIVIQKDSLYDIIIVNKNYQWVKV